MLLQYILHTVYNFVYKENILNNLLRQVRSLHVHYLL